MRNLVFLLVSLITSSATAQTSVYKISKGDTVIYVGGTVHLLRAEDFPLPKEFNQAYEDSDIITFETDTKKLEEPSVAQKVLSEGMFKDDRTLKTELADTTYLLLEKEFKKYNVPFDMMQRMKPSLAIATLSAMAMQKLGATSTGVDMYYTKKAQRDKKEIQQLESVDVQIDKMTNMGDGDMNAFVNYSLNSMTEMEGDLSDLLESWRTGNASKMEEEIDSMKKEYPDSYNSLLVERNNNWMPKILSYLENGTKAFVLVGSLHLYGEDGLLNLLKKLNYKVEQL